MQRDCGYKVQIVDDHLMMRMGLIALAQASSRLQIAWLESPNMSSALEAYGLQTDVDLVLLDLNLPDSQGLQGVQRFLAEFPLARISVFSATEDEFVVRQALALGAVGFIPKSASAETTLHLIESQLGASPATAARPMAVQAAYGSLGWAVAKPFTDSLSETMNATQLKVLELVLAGMSNQEIANASKLALGTVKNTVSSTMLALDVRSRSHLISMFR